VTRELSIETTVIPGLLVINLPLHVDNRGWFKENWQREKMGVLGLPDFAPVQNNVSYNEHKGATRGIHAEPWDKLVSIDTGRIFGAWVDLREGDTFGTHFTHEIGPDTALFVPRGVANAYQTLEEGTVYSYMVNDHWSAEARESYTFVNLADPTLAIDWPLPLETAEISEADRNHPMIADVKPFRRPRTLVVGAGGQLANAFAKAIPDAEFRTIEELDLTDPDSINAVEWRDVDVLINAAAYTAVDHAETDEGRRLAWAVNSAGVAALAGFARRHGFVMVHFSSDYVFDGVEEVHDESEPLSPLGVYGQTKAAGDLAVASVPKHYLIRTSWLIGDGPNFVRTMAGLADKGVSPGVVDDQFGRLSFTEDLVQATLHLLSTIADYGTYNITCDGPAQSWAEIAKKVYALRGRDPEDVATVSTEEYGAGKAMAPRPRNSVLSLDKVTAAGFTPRDGDEALAAYLDAGWTTD